MKFINIVLVHPLKKESYIRSKKGHIDPFRKAIFYSKLRRIVRYLMFLFRDIMTCKSGGKHLHYIYIFLITDSPCFMPRCGPPISSICACPERNESGGGSWGSRTCVWTLDQCPNKISCINFIIFWRKNKNAYFQMLKR